MKIFGEKKSKFYSVERYLLKEGKERRTSFPSLYNLTRQLKLVGNVHKSYKDYKSYIESRTILMKETHEM